MPKLPVDQSKLPAHNRKVLVKVLAVLLVLPQHHERVGKLTPRSRPAHSLLLGPTGDKSHCNLTLRLKEGVVRCPKGGPQSNVCVLLRVLGDCLFVVRLHTLVVPQVPGWLKKNRLTLVDSLKRNKASILSGLLASEPCFRRTGKHSVGVTLGCSTSHEEVNASAAGGILASVEISNFCHLPNFIHKPGFVQRIKLYPGGWSSIQFVCCNH